MLTGHLDVISSEVLIYLFFTFLPNTWISSIFSVYGLHVSLFFFKLLIEQVIEEV